MRPVLLPVWIGVAIALTGGHRARATEPMFVALEYETPASLHGCPDSSELRAMVTGRLGYEPFRTDAARRVVMQVIVVRGRLAGRIEWREASRPPAERLFASSNGDCAELVRTMAFALAVQLQLLEATGSEGDGDHRGDPSTAAPPLPQDTPSPSRSAPPPTPVGAPPPVAPSPDVGSSPGRPRRLTVALGSGLSVAQGVTPDSAFGLRLFGAGRSGRAAVEVDIEGAVPRTTAAPDGAALSHYRLAAMIAACYEPRSFGACLVGSAARLTVQGSGVDAPAGGSGLAFDVGARATAMASAGPRLFIRGRAELFAALTTLTVTLNGAPVWTRPRAAAGLGVDVGFRFE